MKRVAVLLFSVLCLGLMSKAQTLPGSCTAFYPELLQKKSVLSEKELKDVSRGAYGQSKAPRSKTFWIVYSDRNDNPTFIAPNSSQKCGSLNMNETLRIAQIKGDFALVYVEPQVAIEYPKISSEAECKGWIHMSKLLLWHNSLADEKGIYNKALLCYNLDAAKTSTNDSFGKIFYNPNDLMKFDRLVTDMNFYFVMKKEGEMCLLATTHTTDGISDRVLKGWVNTRSFISWNQRSCLEPTWDIDDAEYFADRGDSVRVYQDKKLKVFAGGFPFIKKAEKGTRDDLTRYRMVPSQLRFPILNDNTETIYNCTYTGTMGYSVADEEDPFEYAQNRLSDLTNINICVCIDGTKSMEPFYKPVKEAIKKGMLYFGDQYKIKVGAVIYRDYSDGKYLTECFPLTRPDNQTFSEFLDTGGEYHIKSSPRDRTLEEALYKGIDVALDKVGFRPEQNNLLLVVGDCGNSKTDKSILSSQLVKKIVDKNVNVMGFQVKTGSHDAYSLFNEQLIELIKSSLDIKYGKLMKGMTVKFEVTKDGYELKNDVNSILYVGTHNFPYRTNVMEADKLTSLMVSAIKYCSQSVHHQIDAMRGTLEGAFMPNTTEISQKLDEQFVKQQVGEKVSEYLKKTNSLSGLSGYTKRKISERNIFKPVLFISSDELMGLIERLAPVNDAAVLAANDRKPYIEALKALLKSMLQDPSVTDETLNQKDYREIMNMVSGLNEASGALKGQYTIEEIANPKIVKPDVYKSLVSDFTRKFRNLQKLVRSKYKYTRNINGVKYYWLPLEDLP